jgi:hypothetical protein
VEGLRFGKVGRGKEREAKDGKREGLSVGKNPVFFHK